MLCGCGGKTVDASPYDAGSDSLLDAPVDAPPPDCDGGPLENPAIGCPPDFGGTTSCSSTSKVATCPMDNPCMANTTPSGGVIDHRIGRLRVHAPLAFLSLASIAIDPNVNARCVNDGTERMSTLLRITPGDHTIAIGNARRSLDGTTFSFEHGTLDGASIGAACPGFVGPSAPVSLDMIRVPYAESPGLALTAHFPTLNLAVFDDAPWVFPLHDVVVRVSSIGADGRCIGSWDPKYWCDGDTLGWTTGGSLVGKITLEEADRIPIKSAGCQSLCAILVNDASKTVGGLCKRGADGKIPETGDACVGGASCKNAFVFSTTFASYATPIAP